MVALIIRLCSNHIEKFGQSFDFLLNFGLIEVIKFKEKYKVNFVGEVITPFDYFLSLPKNIEATNDNQKLVLDILKEFKNLKRFGKILLTNKSYTFGKEINSRFFYWKRLYTFFIDHITYEFYYPQKRLLIHSIKKQKGRINPLLTEINRNKTGLGISYEVKNLAPTYIGNVYYSTLKTLEEEFATEAESKKISEMKNFLQSSGYKLDIITLDEK